ncbi:SSI family serine proteinase inhibitor [Nonomuraea sp. NPDC050547]|uniref:SSI family serine proteinase inhibitor n=1 Tax=unclassified Nonomuraea TaxID=2593643 RepID=UPI0037912EFC
MLTHGARHVLLVCDGNPSVHPRATEACAALTATAGNPARMPVAQVLCTEEYSPVKVTATGVWGERLINHTAVYGNRCRMSAATGPLFAF